MTKFGASVRVTVSVNLQNLPDTNDPTIENAINVRLVDFHPEVSRVFHRNLTHL